MNILHLVGAVKGVCCISDVQDSVIIS